MSELTLSQLTTKVALLDPNLGDRITWKFLLKNIASNLRVTELETVDELHGLLLSEIPDLLIFEFDLNDKTGIKWLSDISDNSNRITFPTIMSSHKCPDAMIIDAYQRGVHSFVDKNKLNEDSFSLAITNAFDRVRRIKALAENNGHLRTVVSH